MVDTPQSKTVGRPRSVDLEQLLGAAAEMDLTTITMKALADRVGVGVATVYRYVRDRGSLVRLVAARSTHRAAPVDCGQPWQELLHGYAGSIHSALSATPALMRAYLDGDVGGEVEVEFVDRFLAAMTRRGFAPDRALAIHQAIGLLAVGAAAAAVHMRGHAAAQGPFAEVIAGALRTRKADDLPDLRAALQEYVARQGAPDLAGSVDLLIAGIGGP